MGGGGGGNPCPPLDLHILHSSVAQLVLGIKGLLNQYSLPAQLLCCVLEQETLSHA